MHLFWGMSGGPLFGFYIKNEEIFENENMEEDEIVENENMEEDEISD